MPFDAKINNEIFPIPKHQSKTNPGQNHLAPQTWPGISVESTDTLRRLLTHNWENHHIFVNEYGFHNHIVHAITTQWAFGSPPAIIEASYKEGATMQRDLIPAPNPITHENWRLHLGDEKYYQPYRDFFLSEIQRKSTGAVLEEYIFALDANFVDGLKTQPEMLNRFLEALIHPMIHVGFGIEFGLPGVLAEGLAQTAVHGASSGPIIPKSWFDPSSDLSSRLSQGATISTNAQKTKDVHVFSILARVLADPALAYKNPSNLVFFYPEVVNKHGEAIKRYVEAWTLEGQDLKKKVEEIVWLNTLLYAVGGAAADEFNADFFLAHLVTSSLFLPTIFSVLPSTHSQILFLKAYLAVSLGWYIGVGRPQLDIPKFFSTPLPSGATAIQPPGPHPHPNKDALPSPSSPEAITPNPWLAIIQSTLVHPDDHLVKIQRTFSTWDHHFGGGQVGKGAFGGGVTELQGAEVIDGSLFLRAAVLTMKRLGWVREGENKYQNVKDGAIWDRAGLYGDGRKAPRLPMIPRRDM